MNLSGRGRAGAEAEVEAGALDWLKKGGITFRGVQRPPPCHNFSVGSIVGNLLSSFPPCRVYASRSAHHYIALQLILG